MPSGCPLLLSIAGGDRHGGHIRPWDGPVSFAEEEPTRVHSRDHDTPTGTVGIAELPALEGLACIGFWQQSRPRSSHV